MCVTVCVVMLTVCVVMCVTVCVVMLTVCVECV